MPSIDLYDKAKNITKDQAEVVEILTNMRLKGRVCTWMLIAFFVILVVIIWLIIEDKNIVWGVTVLESILAYTIYKIIGHYFPAGKAAIE